MYKDTYTQEDVNNIIIQIKESIDREILDAIKSNYDAIYLRSAKGINTVEDVFCQQCYGKIYALEGIKEYIDGMVDRLLGVNHE